VINLDDLSAVRRIDPSNFAGLIESFPLQLEQGLKIASACSLPKWKASDFSNIVVAGLGGSAIAAEIVKSYLNYELTIPFSVIRHYQLPEFVNQKTLFIASSYSGNTEETLSAYREARKCKAKMMGMASGGQLIALCKKDKLPHLIIPSGLPPRAALGYSLVSLLVLLGRLGLIKSKTKEIERATTFLNEFKTKFIPTVEKSENQAKILAEKLYGKIPVIYAGEDYFYAVALRWKQQICENAKVLAFCNVFPEFNHNELVGWEKIEPLKDRLAVLILKDKTDHQRVKARMEIVKDIIQQKGVPVIEVESSGKSLLERMLSLIHLGDWVSYYLAILNEVDPTPVEVIDYLKKNLAQVK